MSLDSQAKQLLDSIRAGGALSLDKLSPDEARMQALATLKRPNDSRIPAVDTKDIDLDVAGGRIPMRIYTPNGNGPFPVLIYFHGGGWVMGGIENTDSLCRFFSALAECIVVSVAYRLAPEYKFPVPFEDAYTATEWIFANASSFNGETERLAIGGDSAGGNLAAAITQRARDHSGPAICYQMLFYPVLDHYSQKHASYKEVGDDYFLGASEMAWFWDHYTRPDEDLNNPYLCPLRAEIFSNLPATLVVTAEYDPLRDEGEKYAEKLKLAGVSVEQKRIDGMMHGFINQWHIMDKSYEVILQICKSLKENLHQQSL